MLGTENPGDGQVDRPPFPREQPSARASRSAARRKTGEAKEHSPASKPPRSLLR
jgi:hypothetical protein